MGSWLKVGVILILPLMLVVAATGCGRGVSYATPEDTVNAVLDAMEDLDADKYLDCLVPEALTSEERMEMKAAVKLMKEMDVSISITNRDISVVSETEDSAIVSVSYDVKTTLEGETETGSEDKTWTLVKRNDKWLFTEWI